MRDSAARKNLHIVAAGLLQLDSVLKETDHSMETTQPKNMHPHKTLRNEHKEQISMSPYVKVCMDVCTACICVCINLCIYIDSTCMHAMHIAT